MAFARNQNCVVRRDALLYLALAFGDGGRRRIAVCLDERLDLCDHYCRRNGALCRLRLGHVPLSENRQLLCRQT